MAYTKQTWTDNISVLSAERFNHKEDGIALAEQLILIPDITVDTGVVSSNGITFDGTKYIKSANANYLYNGDDAVKLGKMSYTSLAADVGYTLYIQSDGTIGFESTSVPCAVILSTSEIFVDFHPTYENPKEYTEDMIQFVAIPGTSGIVRLKIEMPADADGVMVRRKTSAWASGDDNTTGDLVANITDDSDYKDDNEWFEDDDGGSDLTDETRYYYKAFAHKGSIYNEAIGSNETDARAGILENEWTGDNVSGDTIVDDAGTINGTGTSVTIGTGKIDEDMQGGSSSYIALDSVASIADKSYSFWVYYTDSGDKACLGNDTRGTIHVWIDGNTLKVGGGNAGDPTDVTASLVPSTWHHVVVSVLGSTISLYLDNVSIGSVTKPSSNNLNINNLGRCNLAYTAGDTVKKMNCRLDQVRRFSLTLNTDEISNLYNGGDGC